MKSKFNVEFLKEAVDFLDNVDEKARDKIIYNITKARFSNDKELFKKITDEIWEFRTYFNKTFYRFLSFWDKSDKNNPLVIITQGLIKKTDKIPLNELNKAKLLRKKYFEIKHKKYEK